MLSALTPESFNLHQDSQGPVPLNFTSKGGISTASVSSFFLVFCWNFLCCILQLLPLAEHHWEWVCPSWKAKKPFPKAFSMFCHHYWAKQRFPCWSGSSDSAGDSQLSKGREALTCHEQKLHRKIECQMLKRKELRCWDCNVVDELCCRKNTFFFFLSTYPRGFTIVSYFPFQTRSKPVIWIYTHPTKAVTCWSHCRATGVYERAVLGELGHKRSVRQCLSCIAQLPHKIENWMFPSSQAH